MSALAPERASSSGPSAADESRHLLQAASALLRALAAIQCADEPPAGGLQVLHDGLAREVVEFCRACDRTGVRHEHMLATRYALCTALDEALSCKPWAGGEQAHVGPWSQYALLQEFHQEGEGGKTVFLLVGRLAAQPLEHRGVLEVMLHILALGFMGDYRRRADGQQALDLLRHRLLALLGDDATSVDLAPHARPAAPVAPRASRGLLWCLVPTALLLLGLLGGVRMWSEHLEQQARALRESLLGMRATVDARMPADAPTATSPTGRDPRRWLQAAVRAGRAQVLRDADRWVVRLGAEAMFEPASSTLRPDIDPLLRQVADALQACGGDALVVGHTDDTPKGAGHAAMNVELSRRRAAEVAQRLQRLGVAPGSLTVQGRGAADPVGDNATPAGRARNRRVDIVLRPAST